MQHIGRLWAGRLYGTNTGNIFVNFTKTENPIIGDLRINDNIHGLAVYHVSGDFDGSTLTIEGFVSQGTPDAIPGQFRASGKLTPTGSIFGEWHSTFETAGTFELFPHDQASEQENQGHFGPEQIHTSNITLGAVRLFVADVEHLAETMRSDFHAGRIIATYAARGNEVSMYFEDFLKNQSGIIQLRYLKMSIQEPEHLGINKVVIVELSSLGDNTVRVQGTRETWVIGKAEAIARRLRQNESALVTTYRRYGLGINQVLFLSMLVLMPAIQTIWGRAVFAVFVVSLLAILYGIHSHAIPNAIVLMGAKQPSLFNRLWPTALSWGIAATSALAASFVFYWLTQGSSH